MNVSVLLWIALLVVLAGACVWAWTDFDRTLRERGAAVLVRRQSEPAVGGEEPIVDDLMISVRFEGWQARMQGWGS